MIGLRQVQDFKLMSTKETFLLSLGFGACLVLKILQNFSKFLITSNLYTHT